MNAHSLTKALNGSWFGSYGMCSCPGLSHQRGDKRPSLKVSDSDRGEPLVHCFAGCDWRDVKTALRRQGLLENFCGSKRADFDQRRFEDLQRKQQEQDRKRSAAAHRVWDRCSPAASGGLADTYLRSRGLWLPQSEVIREIAGIKHADSGRIFPAMICAVGVPCRTRTQDSAVKGRCPEHFGIHRTFLRSDGGGKADVDRNKAMLGRCSGSAVQLFPAGEKMAVAEGIETALAVHRLSDLPVWAALSTSGLINLTLPDLVREIVIAADHDANGAGERAAEAAAKRWTTEGRKVEIAMPPETGSDWLDHYQEVA